MSFTLKKSFRFESAHRLAKNYNGKCSNIHGHSWNGEIALECSSLDKYDFGIDYKDIKVFTKIIEDKLDHAILLQQKDVEIMELCKKNNWLYVVFTENPTSETIAKWIFDCAKEHFKEDINPFIKIKFVSIKETCTSECIYTGEN